MGYDNTNNKWPCCYNLTDDCPVREHWKLRPESLVLFCRNCPLLKGISIEKIKSKLEEY